MSELSPERPPAKKRFARFLFSRNYPMGSDVSIRPTHSREEYTPTHADEQRITSNLLASRMHEEVIMPQIEDYDPALFEAAVDRVFGLQDTDVLVERKKRKMAASVLRRSPEAHDRKINAAERRIRKGNRFPYHA